MGQRYTYLTIWEKKLAILHIYGARAVFLLFCDHQDIRSESCKLGNGVAETTLNILKHQRLYGTYI